MGATNPQRNLGNDKGVFIFNSIRICLYHCENIPIRLIYKKKSDELFTTSHVWKNDFHLYMYTIWHVLQYNGSCRYCDHSVTERMWVLQIIYRIEALMHICSTKVILTLFLKIVSFSNFLKTWTFKINSTSVQNHAVYQVVTNHISCSFNIFHNGEC